MRRRCRASQMIYLVTFNHERLYDIVSDEFEIWMAYPVADGGSGTGKKVVKHSNVMAKEHETIDKMRTNETSPASDKDALALARGKEFDRGETSESGIGN
eukprot:GHVO01026222.1.p3 GENE.GHVO01026222.1~~GHVO01026222.1.p3  ORF type:complete len:100 (-),score=16.34 GHVO01026222.1:121-420(-)